MLGSNDGAFEDFGLSGESNGGSVATWGRLVVLLGPLGGMLDAILGALGLYCAILEAILAYLEPYWAILDALTGRGPSHPDPRGGG